MLPEIESLYSLVENDVIEELDSIINQFVVNVILTAMY